LPTALRHLRTLGSVPEVVVSNDLGARPFAYTAALRQFAGAGCLASQCHVRCDCCQSTNLTPVEPWMLRSTDDDGPEGAKRIQRPAEQQRGNQQSTQEEQHRIKHLCPPQWSAAGPLLVPRGIDHSSNVNSPASQQLQTCSSELEADISSARPVRLASH